MTAVRNRFTALQAAAVTLAALSQLQGTVSGPLVLTVTHEIPVGRQTDRANPQRPVYPLDLRTWTPPSLVLSTLFEVPPESFPDGRSSTNDHPNPQGYPPAHRGFIHIPVLQTSLADQGETPLSTGFGSTHGRPFPSFLRTWEPPSLLLTTLAEAPAVTLPEGQRSLADYAAPIYPVSLRTWTPAPLVLSPLAHSIPTGRLAGLDQPNPRGYPFPISDRGFTESSSLSLLYTEPPEIDVVFRAPLITRWAKRPHPVELLTIAPPSFMARGPISMQLRGGDWPNPRGYPFPLALRTWAHSFILFGESSPAVPSHHTDPNPSGPIHPVSLRTLAVNLLQTTLLPAPETPPVGTRGRVEGVPPGPAYVVTLRTWEQHLQQTTLVPPPEPIPDGKPMPGWPNPRGYPFPNANLGYVQQPSQDLLAQPPPVEEDLDLVIRLGVVTEKVIRLGVVTEKVIRLKVGH